MEDLETWRSLIIDPVELCIGSRVLCRISLVRSASGTVAKKKRERNIEREMSASDQ